MELLERALRNDASVTLDVAALEMARIECPGLSPAPYLQRLDELAAAISNRLPPGPSGPAFLKATSQVLFREMGFRGNEADYYNPRNSCLNVVLDSRLGIPITLSLIYLEVARRLGKTVVGIGLPGHFVVQYRETGFSSYVDPYHRGRAITEADCNELSLDHAHVEIAQDPAALRPVGSVYILIRMLNNLRSAYFRTAEFKKAASVLDLLLGADPANSDYYKARGVARLQLRQFRGANSDFQTYLEQCPDASDREDIRKQVEHIHRWLGSLN